MSDKSDDVIDRGRAWLTGIGLGAIAIAALVVAFVIGTNYNDEATPMTGVEKTVEKNTNEPPPKPEPDTSGPGAELFASSCGSCHVLAAAGTSGAVGPDLDVIEPDAETVETTIHEGSGAMPAGLLQGQDAKDVAEYVAQVAGQ